MGGEKSTFLNSMSFPPGSPPRRRGKAFSVLRRQFRFRITPAWAGKRVNHLRFLRRQWDHPRMGGKKSLFSGISAASTGSPPHGRGKGRRVVDHHPLPGITPAWAGKRLVLVDLSLNTGDHPCVGGEKLGCNGTQLLKLGSPPRWRGKDVLILDGAGVVGITPAWAGKRPPPCR